MFGSLFVKVSFFIPLIDLILAQPELDELARFDAALISAAAAGFADRIDLVESSLKSWPYPQVEGSRESMPVHANACALLALFKGQPDQARNILNRIEGFSYQDAYSPVAFGYGVYGTALSYLWEGRVALAEQLLRPALADLEKELGRRHPVTCTLAALLAQACWELGLDDDPRVLLADRLPVLEHQSLPDTLISAYRTLASFADFHGRQDHALSMLNSLAIIGKERSIIRLQVVALFELVRIHAREGRIDTATALNQQIKELLKGCPEAQLEPIAPLIKMFGHLAEAIVLLAQDDLQPLPLALESVDLAVSIAKDLKRTAALVAAQLLRAQILSRAGDPTADSVKAEALSLGRAEKMVRLLRDLGGESNTVATPVLQQPENIKAEIKEVQKVVHDSALLTPKEQEVLSLLSRNFSNKEIARAMDISVETVKWHLKNLFSKLDAADRKHVVARARMLGHI
jgi:LuxR family maltose regulon positive regulatory protein